MSSVSPTVSTPDTRDTRDASAYPHIYRNRFDGYTTTFYVWKDRRECVVCWDNTSPIEAVFPYSDTLEPEMLKNDIRQLLERAEDVTYEEYPLRSVSIQTRVSETHEVFWWPVIPHDTDTDSDTSAPHKRPRLRILSGGPLGSDMQYRVAAEMMVANHSAIEANLMSLLNSTQY